MKRPDLFKTAGIMGAGFIGDAICFDAMDTSNWTRQLHVVDLIL